MSVLHCPSYVVVLHAFLTLCTRSLGEVITSDSRLGILRGTESSLDLSKVIALSSSPRAHLYEGFLSDSECDYLIMLASGKLDPPSRNPLGSATFLRKYQDGLVRRIEDRLSDWLFLPRSSPEAIKPLRYNENQTYDVHYEFYSNPTGDKRKGNRAATVFLFLSTPAEGGEIVFPSALVNNSQRSSAGAAGGGSKCTSKGLVVKPRKGAALFFINMLPDGKPDTSATFTDCPVVSGDRWMAAKWIAVQKYAERRDPNECTDEHEMCEQWAERGECERNPKYMVGESGFIGTCRKACKVCEKVK